MTTPDRDQFDDAPEADRVEQSIPVVQDEDEAWRGAQDVGAGRDGQAAEADLLDQAREVPLDDPDRDRWRECCRVR